MRITNNMLVNNMLNNITNNLTRMDKYQNQLATGKKIQVPSDDPVVAARALKLRTDVSEVEQYQRNIKDAQSWLEVTDGALDSIGSVLQRARELAVETANGSNTPEDTQKVQKEIEQLKTQLIHLANTTYAGRYIFSGYSTDKKLINDDEASSDFGRFDINVNRLMENIKYEIGIGDDININVVGGDLFNYGGNAVNTGNGIEGDAVAGLTVEGTNDTLVINVDNLGNVTASIPHAEYKTPEALADAVQTAVNSALKAAYPTANPISVTSDNGKLQFISGSTSGGSIAVDPSSTAQANLGLSTSTAIRGSLHSGSGVEGNADINSLVIDGTNNQLTINVDGLGDVPVTIPSATPGPAYASFADLATAIQTAVNTAVHASYPNASPVYVTAQGDKLQIISSNEDPSVASIFIDPSSNGAENLGLAALGASTTTPIKGNMGQTGAMIQDFDKFIAALQVGDWGGISKIIGNIDNAINNLLRIRADVGARQNRLDLTANRLDSDNINFTKLMSQNEDVDMAETIMNLQSEENVYRASLSGGARIIQPSLVDFLK